MSGKNRLITTVVGFALAGLIGLADIPTAQAQSPFPVRTAVYATSDVGAVQVTPVQWRVYRPYYRPIYRPYWYGPRYYVYRPYIRPVYPRYFGYYNYPRSFYFSYAPAPYPYYGAYYW